MLADETVVVMRSDRRNYLPYGLDGGAPGTPSWNLLNPGPGQQAVPVMPMEPLVMRRDEVLCHIGAGGGGHGDPLERDPMRCLEDVREERYSADYIRDVYGVVLNPQTGAIDQAETEKARAALRERRKTRSAEPQPAYLRHFHAPFGIGDFALIGERFLKTSSD
jgi:N-methylhydantoinase B